MLLKLATQRVGRGMSGTYLSGFCRTEQQWRWHVDQDPEGKYEALEKYSRDLTKAAREGKLDPVIGRDDEIRRAIQILSRRSKNNPCLIGEPGVGKTAVRPPDGMRPTARMRPLARNRPPARMRPPVRMRPLAWMRPLDTMRPPDRVRPPARMRPSTRIFAAARPWQRHSTTDE